MLDVLSMARQLPRANNHLRIFGNVYISGPESGTVGKSDEEPYAGSSDVVWRHIV